MDTHDGAFIVASGSALLLMVKVLWDAFLKRRAALEEQVQHHLEDSLRALQTQLAVQSDRLNAIGADLRVLVAASSVHEGRINGISDNYGKRLGRVEQEVAAMRAVLNIRAPQPSPPDTD